MSDIFKRHIAKFAEVNDKEFSKILTFFQVQKVKKKENLLVEGHICTTNYFVLKGCLRKFFVNTKGVEQTTEFAIENWWITDLVAYEHKLPSEFYIQAVENAEVLSIENSTEATLLSEFPVMERYFRFIYQRAYAASQMRMKYLYDLSKEEFYHHLNDHYPEFVQRIPQYLIASYLGFTPEYLSEIRAKRRS
ncbi:Crp/Fnr family transcriptional regulator [Chryseosolibacter indicus]|uniref:Crp/Fnr family transcriptional regulator n=1 Tax=Chryseosolibacter indicus TaxID=2782351 RepID=A0ABS5VU22_9BACT|nr:Crp/Fnr family transcriptional regulator [Chryseosolibacter indicus]MBT1704923.1 Crp/Fnr family transcriptional regulator [Chryseosolibacter indicus]